MDATRAVMAMGAIGVGAAALLALPEFLPPAVAQEEPMRTLLSSPSELWPPAFNPDDLVKWDYFVQPGVSIEPVRESTVRKIGYGKTTFVSVMETESGIYSTDGLASPNIQYPGIVKEPKSSVAQLLWMWGAGHWASATAFSESSFVAITPIEDGNLVVTDDGACVVRADSLYC